MKKLLSLSYLAFIVIALSVYLQSCKHENVDVTYTPEKDEMFAPLGMANEVAENINKSEVVLKTIDKSLLKSAKYIGKRKIKNTRTISDKKKTPYFYIFNYDSGGFSIVPADQRIEPNLAYGETGSFNLDSLPYGVLRWLNANAQLINHLRVTNAKQSATVNYLWSNAQCEPPASLELKSANYCPPPPCTSSSTSSTVGPLLTTTWDQGNGYNDYCPVLSGGPNGHAYTGCSTTAIAQVMYYWKYPSTYNWDAMTLNSGNDEVAKLMGDIFPGAIDSYDTGGSSCANDYNIRHTFLNFGYQSASLAGFVNGITENGGYNYQTVVSNLKNRWPVILGAYNDYVNILGLYSYPTGSGHTWVCDGYIQSFTTDCESGIGYGTLYFHMNWGWNGQHNGWYAYNAWPYYSFFPDMIYNIHP